MKTVLRYGDHKFSSTKHVILLIGLEIILHHGNQQMKANIE